MILGKHKWRYHTGITSTNFSAGCQQFDGTSHNFCIFKVNCADFRNTLTVDIFKINLLSAYQRCKNCYLTTQEYKRLLELIAPSSNAPVRPGKKQPQNERMCTNSDPRKETNRKNANTTKRSQNRLHGTFTVVNKNIDRERTHGSKKATDWTTGWTIK